MHVPTPLSASDRLTGVAGTAQFNYGHARTAMAITDDPSACVLGGSCRGRAPDEVSGLLAAHCCTFRVCTLSCFLTSDVPHCSLSDSPHHGRKASSCNAASSLNTGTKRMVQLSLALIRVCRVVCNAG